MDGTSSLPVSVTAMRIARARALNEASALVCQWLLGEQEEQEQGRRTGSIAAKRKEKSIHSSRLPLPQLTCGGC